MKQDSSLPKQLGLSLFRFTGKLLNTGAVWNKKQANKQRKGSVLLVAWGTAVLLQIKPKLRYLKLLSLLCILSYVSAFIFRYPRDGSETQEYCTSHHTASACSSRAGNPLVLGIFTHVGHIGHVPTSLCPQFSIWKIVILHKHVRVILNGIMV